VAGGLVVAAGVEGELAQEFAGGGVDDADVEVLDEQDVGGAVAGDGFGPGGVSSGGVARWGRDRCGRRVLQYVVKASAWVWSWVRSAGWGCWAASHFFRVCWKRPALPWVWGVVGLPVLLLDAAAA
jgi:hypothetical protein